MRMHWLKEHRTSPGFSVSRAHPTPLAFPIIPMADTPTSMDVTTGPPPSESPQDALVASFTAVLPGVQPVSSPPGPTTSLPTTTPLDDPTTSTSMDAETDPQPMVDDATSPTEYWWRDTATGAWYRKVGWDGVWTSWSEADAPPSKRRRTGGPEEAE